MSAAHPDLVCLLIPFDLGASCVEFLSVQEQCSLKPTCARLRELVEISLDRFREKSVLSLNGRLAIDELLENVAAACPRIGRFFSTSIQRSTKISPVEFDTCDSSNLVNLNKVSVQFLADLSCADHIRTVDLFAQVCQNFGGDLLWTIARENLMDDFPELRTVYITCHNFGIEHPQNPVVAFDALEKRSAQQYFKDVPEVHLKFFTKCWSDKLSKALGLWPNLCSIGLYGSFEAHNEVVKLATEVFTALVDLPSVLHPDVQRVSINITLVTPNSLDQGNVDIWQKLFKRILDAFVARFPSWDGSVSHRVGRSIMHTLLHVGVERQTKSLFFVVQPGFFVP